MEAIMSYIIIVRYADTQRPAVGLTVEHWHGDTFITSRVTDRGGRIKYLGIPTSAFYPGQSDNVLKLRRGALYFSEVPLVPGPYGSAFLDIQPTDWPDFYQELRQKLREKSRWSMMARAANQVLKALQNEDTLEQLINPARVNEKPPGDNPHIVVGALVASLCITRLYHRPRAPTEIVNKESHEMWAIDSALQGLFHWLKCREQSSGYFCRWATWPRKISNWEAEPSLDEYSGLLLGLRWAAELGKGVFEPYPPYILSIPPSSISQVANDWLFHISDYLTKTGGWLVTQSRISSRPGGGYDFYPSKKSDTVLVARGPDILANAFPLRCILPHYFLQYPLRLDDRVNKYIDVSIDDANLLNEASKIWHQYPMDVQESMSYHTFLRESKQTLDPLWTWQFVKNMAKELGGWDNAVVMGALGMLIAGPVGALLGALVGYGIKRLIEKGIEVTETAIDDVELWTDFAEVLGQPLTLLGWDDNIPIFDRYSLAASWGAPSSTADNKAQEIAQDEMAQLLPQLHGAFNTRATRPIGNDRWGWQLLGVGARIWLGSDSWSAWDLLVNFDANVEYAVPPPVEPPQVEELPDPNFKNVEGFVLGWAITCLALDLDPGIEWAGRIDQRFQEVAPQGISLKTELSASVRDVTLTAAKEPIEEPYAIGYPIVVDSFEGRITLYVSAEEAFYKFYSSGRKKINKPAKGMVLNETLEIVRPFKIAMSDPGPPGTIPKHYCFTFSDGKWTDNTLLWNPPLPPDIPGGRRDFMVVLTAWEHDYTKKAKVRQAAKKTIEQIASVLPSFLSPGYVIENVAEKLQSSLQDWLPSLYPYPVAKRNYPFSDDDFIGVQVITLSIDAKTTHRSKDFDVELSWSGERTALRIRGSIQYKRAYRAPVTEDWSSGSINPAVWNSWGNPQTSVVNGQLQIASVLGSGFFGLDRSAGGASQNLTGSSVINMLINAGNQSLAYWEVYPITIKKADGTDNSILFYVSNNHVYAAREENGVRLIIGSEFYSPFTHIYFRVRSRNGKIYYDTSADGRTWNNLGSIPNPFDITQVVIGMKAGTRNPEASTTTATFDNFNITP